MKMDKEKVSLIVKNMESLVRLLKIEIEQEEKEYAPLSSTAYEDIFSDYKKGFVDSEYEPDYYEEP